MDDLTLIKRHYGEKMMHLCRELFPTLLETPGLLYTTLTRKFEPSRLLYEDIVEDDLYDSFKSIILHSADPKTIEKSSTTRTPQELLDEAGYILYECHSEKDIQSFKKYYKPGEELCTFNGGRLDKSHVFFAVKKDVDKIKRKDNPEREDEYGTSVISIQFHRGPYNVLSIKNRYNHTVWNPDATFCNNLDNIIPGLTEAFEETYGLNINNGKPVDVMNGYVRAEDGKYYKYNYESNNIYYCPDNVIIDNFRVKKFDKSRYLVIESFVIDLQEKTIRDYDDEHYESFTKSLPKIESIKILNIEGGDKKVIINDDIEIIINKLNQIKSYTNPHTTVAGNYFLHESSAIEEINLPNVEAVGISFLRDAERLTKISLPKCKDIGCYFLYKNKSLRSIDLPSVERISSSFMQNNRVLESINIQKCREIGTEFLPENRKLKSLILPYVKVLDGALCKNLYLGELYLPNCEIIRNSFTVVQRIKIIDLPSVKIIGNEVFYGAISLRKLLAPKCIEIGDDVLRENEKLEEIDISSCKKIGKNFLRRNTELRKIDISSVEELDKDGFLDESYDIEIITGTQK